MNMADYCFWHRPEQKALASQCIRQTRKNKRCTRRREEGYGKYLCKQHKSLNKKYWAGVGAYTIIKVR